MDKTKKRFGDRKDGTLLRDLDPMHFITPIIYPNRCDNEAYIYETVDLTAIDAYLAKLNENEDALLKKYDGTPFKYTLFHLVVAAIIKTVTLRPKMNRFIVNKNTYQRNGVSASFVVKKQFSDEAHEGLAFIRATDDTTLNDIYAEIHRQVTHCRKGGSDASNDAMDILNKLPRFVGKFAVNVLTVLDRHGKVPQSIIATDPYYSSVVLTNLGSIKLKAGYHHLTNWGTNSLFLAIGQIKERPYFDADGNVTMKRSVDFGITIDERLGDGYYYSKSIKLFKQLLEHPELLELPASQEVDY